MNLKMNTNISASIFLNYLHVHVAEVFAELRLAGEGGLFDWWIIILVNVSVCVMIIFEHYLCEFLACILYWQYAADAYIILHLLVIRTRKGLFRLLLRVQIINTFHFMS